MTAGKYNLQILQGKLFDKTFTWTISSTPVNLTGYSAKLEIIDRDTSAPVIELSTALDDAGNGIILGGSAGTVEVVIKTAKTKTFGFSIATYELQLTRPDGEDVPFLVGRAYLTTEPVDL